MSDVVIAEVGPQPIDIPELEASVRRAGAGAIVTFSGVVRDEDRGRTVQLLEYEGHPRASEWLADIAREIAALPAVQAVALRHRVGTLAIGDVAFGAAVACGHRREAFEACARAVEEVKARLPIWKRQVFADGREEWVGAP